MGRKYKVISADGHVETPPDVFVKYVPERYKDRAPRLIHLPEGGEGWLIEGQPMLRNGQNIAGRDKVKFSGGTYFNEDGSPAEGAGPAEQRLLEQDLDGIDAEVVTPREIKAAVPIINTSRDTRYPILGASLQKRGGVARHDAVAWGFARAARHFEDDRIMAVGDVDEIACRLPRVVAPGDKVLLKASRGVRLERVIPVLESRFEEAGV